MKNLVIAIDIGNTNMHVGLVAISKLTCLKRIDFPAKSVKSHLLSAIKSFDADASSPAIVCSVNSSAGKIAYDLIKNHTPHLAKKFQYHKNFPITLAYKNSSSLGSDRLASLLYAHYAYPGKNVIIINAGTAVTVDLMKKGKHFAGGVIMPGPSTQFNSLHAGTAQLPFIKFDQRKPDFPGVSTESCITAGVYYGIAAAISRCVKELSKSGSSPIVLATGGAWKSIKQIADLRAEYIPDLTLIGTGCFA